MIMKLTTMYSVLINIKEGGKLTVDQVPPERLQYAHSLEVFQSTIREVTSPKAVGNQIDERHEFIYPP